MLPLLHLARAPTPMRQRNPAASLSLDSSSVARLLEGLQASRLFERREEARDRRAKTVVLTAQGRSIVEQVDVVASQARQPALAGLTDDEIAIDTRILQQFVSVLVEGPKRIDNQETDRVTLGPR